MEMSKFLKIRQKIHFIGIGGVGMSSLSLHLKHKGFEVSGSDICAKNAIFLKKHGIIVQNKHSKYNLKNSKIVVYTSAIKEDNPELKEAKLKGLTLIKRSELLGQILDEYSLSIAVSGSHGKTTTTDMLASVLIESGLDPTVFLGGEDKIFGNYRFGKGNIVLAEACEYQRNFLDLRPKISVVLNVDNDHMDTYKDINEAVDAFKCFIKNSISVINADDKNAKSLIKPTTITFGIESPAQFRAKNIRKCQNGYSFSAYQGSLKLGRIKLSVDGRHNVYNALCALSVCQTLNIPFSVQKKALERFSGVQRRNEFLGELKNLKVYADYAHHPKEITAMLQTFNNHNQKFITVFQPHTYSRTALLMQDFIECFSSCSPLIIYKTFPARESFCPSGSAKTLYKNLQEKGLDKVYYANTKKQIIRIIDKFNLCFDKVLFLGAGDIYDLAKSLVQNGEDKDFN